jgi:hypothetical protein
MTEPRYANYPSDVTHIIGEVKGPGEDGKAWVATDATYDPDTNMTRVEFDEFNPGPQ